MQLQKPQRLARSSSDRMVAGVCAGIASYFGWPITRVRIAYAALSVLSAAFPGLVVYLLLWMIMPNEPREPRRFRLDDSRQQ
jgi:phage shock protein PspC (stress-responsive transcriptional regulator)